MPLKQILVYISYASPLLLMMGSLLAAYHYKWLSKRFKVIGIYIFIALVIDIISRKWGFFTDSKNNLFIIPVFGFIELAFFSLLFYKHILKSKSKILKTYIYTALSLVLIDIFFNDYQEIERFQSYGRLLANLSIIFYCLLSIWNSIKGNIDSDKEAIILSFGALLYFSINLLVYLPLNFLINGSPDIIFYFWTINLLLTILFYALLIYLIWQNGKTRKHLRLA